MHIQKPARRTWLPLAVVWLLIAAASAQAQTDSRANSDAAIKQAIIRHSIATYRGNCPCPYSTDRAGRSCGRRSAYSKPGGASPVCYVDDVTDPMIANYRKSVSGQKPAPARARK